MSQQNPTLSEYYKRFWQRFRHEIRKAWWEAVIAIIAVIVVLFFQFYFGWTKKGETVSSALINISPYIAILIAYVARHLIRTPALLDAETQAQIGGLRSELDKITSDLTRPKFKINPSIDALGEYDEDNRYVLALDFENNGSRSAADIECQALLVEEDAHRIPRMVDTSVASEIAVNDSIPLQTIMTVTTHDEPPLFIVSTLKYKDAVTGRPYKQAFFIKWGGVKRGVLQKIHHLTIPERDQLKDKLKPYLAEFIVEDSQNVGSIPSSKMD